MAPEKTCGPSTTLCFAGIELDTIRFEARLPLEKLRKCADLISDFQKRKKITLKSEYQARDALRAYVYLHACGSTLHFVRYHMKYSSCSHICCAK